MASKRTESIRVMKQLRQDADRIATHFHLKYKELKAEKNGVNGHYGICYEDGEIKIRLRHATSGKLLKYSSLVNTLCHELTHLRYFDHGDDFKRLYFQILKWAKEQKIYQPRQMNSPPTVKAAPPPHGTFNEPKQRKVVSAPMQLSLFETL
jgi:predicted metal-dependent hydrolase